MRSLPEVVLASASPRRRELLSPFFPNLSVVPPKLLEDSLPGEDPRALVERLALAKARQVASRHPGALVVGADTVVVLEGEVLGKPSSREEVVDMLTRLSGRWHEVVTGVALVWRDRHRVSHATTRVRFSSLSAREIEFYAATEEPMDKAGAYGIQGVGGLFVSEIRGSYTNVVGLPLHLLYRLMGEMGWDMKEWVARAMDLNGWGGDEE